MDCLGIEGTEAHLYSQKWRSTQGLCTKVSKCGFSTQFILDNNIYIYSIYERMRV